MNPKTIPILNEQNHVIATAHVTPASDHYEGTIDLDSTPKSIRDLFAEFEEIVNGQMLSFLDEIQAKIAGLDLRAEIDGIQWKVADLQVYPDQGDVSFRVTQAASTSRGQTNGAIAGHEDQAARHFAS